MHLSEARHAFVTGGASGIGLAVAEALAERGVPVTIADINEDNLGNVDSLGRKNLRTVRLDVRDRDGWARAREEAQATFGAVDILINNAGIAPDGAQLSDMDPAAFDRVIGINLVGVFNGINTFGAAMRAAGRGHIVNTASLSGMMMDGPGIGTYGPSKAGVIAMSEVLALEMEPHGVGVTVLLPSYVATSLMENTRALGAGVSRPDASLLEVPTKPEQIAPMLLRAIEENRLFCITHSYRREAFQARNERILAAFEETEKDEKDLGLG